MTSFMPISIVLLAIPGHTADDIDYARQVKPLFAKYCANCHGAKKQFGGLRLDMGPAILKGGNSGAAVMPARARPVFS